MGTTADKLQYLNGTKTAIKNAIVAKGVAVPDGTTFRAYADKISSIQDVSSLPTQGAKTVTPTTTEQIAVASGRYTTGDVKVAGDANLVSKNIAKGVSIFGVTGSHVGESTITGTINFESSSYCTVFYLSGSNVYNEKLNGAKTITISIKSGTMFSIGYEYGGSYVQQSAYTYTGLAIKNNYSEQDLSSRVTYRQDFFYANQNFTLNCS